MNTHQHLRQIESPLITGETSEDVKRFHAEVAEFEAEAIPEGQIQNIIDREVSLVDTFVLESMGDFDDAGSF